MSEVSRHALALPAGLGDPISWTAPEKSLFVSVVYLTFTLWYFAAWSYVLLYPDAAPYVDQAFLPKVLSVQTGMIAAWLSTIVVAVIARRRGAPARGLVPLTIALAVFELIYGSYFFGFHTSLFGGLTIVASGAVGWVLFERRAINAAAGCLAVVLVGLEILEQLHWIPYAPLFREAPFRNGVLDGSWLVTMGGVTLVMMVFILAIVYFVIERWHDREQKITSMSQQLARANEVISRYIASQLAEQIRDGHFEELERHERRRLTLFFSDIEEFADTADHIEPEDLAEALNLYLSEMARIGQRHGGTIDKFAGDAVMIFFGAPAPMADRIQALHAVEMAIEMQEAMIVLREKWRAVGFERPFHIRIGINTGHASIGNFGSPERADYTAIGRNVNLAARLQAQCPPDRILLSHATWVLVRDEIECEAKGEISVKGIRDPVFVYEVMGRRSPASVPRSDTLES